MSDTKYLSDMPVVKVEDVIPLFTGEEVIMKLATAVNGMRDMRKLYGRVDGKQLMDLELMYSLAIYLRDKK